MFMTDPQLIQMLNDVIDSSNINTQYLIVIGYVLSFALGYIGGNQRQAVFMDAVVYVYVGKIAFFWFLGWCTGIASRFIRQVLEKI